MAKRCQADITEIVKNAFRDIVICLGGIFLLHRVSNDAIYSISNAVEEIYNATMKKLAKLNSADVKKAVENKKIDMHPAIEKLLEKIVRQKDG